MHRYPGYGGRERECAMKNAGMILFIVGSISAITSNVIFVLVPGGTRDGGRSLLLMAITVIGYLVWRRTPGLRVSSNRTVDGE
jgi:hypothetical protein